MRRRWGSWRTRSRAWQSERSIRALIVTGAGEKAFVAGADINELARLTPVERERCAARGQRIFRQLETMPKLSVAAVNGFALGGGLELAMAARCGSRRRMRSWDSRR